MNKPLNRKAYGSIPHLPSSRMGSGDHSCSPGQARIATVKTRDSHDEVIVQEKLDGSCCAVAVHEGKLLPLSRAGYLAISSPYKQHHLFHEWVLWNEWRFRSILQEGERLVGEWLMQAHGTRYAFPDGMEDLLFAPFDIMTEDQRMPYAEFRERIKPSGLIPPATLSVGEAYSVDSAMQDLCLHEGGMQEGTFGYRYAVDPVEGAVWRVERDKLQPDRTRKRIVDFLVKYVREDKVDGKYFGDEPVWNVTPERLRDTFRY